MTYTGGIRDGSEGLDEHGDARQAPVGPVPWIAALRSRRQPTLGQPPFVRPDLGPVELTEIPYMASGGMSALMQLDSGEELQVEIHRESYGVLWSTQLLADTVVRNLAPLFPNLPAEATAVYADGFEVDGDVATVMDSVADGEVAKQIEFVRLRYQDSIVTWEQRRVRFLGSEHWFVAGQVGFLADRLDRGYLEKMIMWTATPRLAGSAAELARRAARVVADADKFPVEELGEAGELPAGGTMAG